MGNNGAGKTTLFRLMLDLLKADSGDVCLDGTDVSQSEDWKSHVGSLYGREFSDRLPYPEEYFQFCGRMYGFDAATLHERIYRYERFLGDEILKEKKYIRNLSAGNKQKTVLLPLCCTIRNSSFWMNRSISSTLLHNRYSSISSSTIVKNKRPLFLCQATT